MKGFIVKSLIVCLLLSVSLAKASTEVSFFYEKKFIVYSATASNTPSDSIKKESKTKKTSKKRNERITFETFDDNYAKAVDYYNKHQFLSAARLFEDLYPLSLGTVHADTILFMFADCYYQNRDYEMASFHFKDYARRYPGSDRAELASLMSIKAVYNISPYYALDQSETLYAIDELNTFIALYPHSQYMDECNQMLDELREKLAKKDFELLKLYFETENYRAAQIATDNFLKTYSYSKYAAEALFILVKNNFAYAKKSVETKMVERYDACIAAYNNLYAAYPESEWVKDAQKYRDEAKKQIDKLIKKSK